ncbi:endo-beta-1,6-galactanase [Folsomia candida]|uniref:endo-beta-1,6-galactanase n=1 Tax=Folsomia candida TaxID=158441 RepID=UPI000B900E33|nr:endo-beta-1,6-galactanase [Folsomia candida]
MDKKIGIFLLVVLGGLIFTPGGFPLGEEYFVEPSVVLVEEWEGWGTSLAWWADMLGGMQADVFDYVMDALFNPEKLNLNIVRYVIGGTTPEYVTPYPCGAYRPGANSETFRDGLGENYNWTRDPRQIAVLKKSIEMGANILEAFSNSPPQWMTVSGCSKGNYLRFPLHDNLDPEKANAFANYVTDVIQHFRTEWNITFEYYAPFNEPFGLWPGIGSWFGRDASQEGCNMKMDTMAEVLREMDATFRAKGMDYVTLTGADETQINTAIATANYFSTPEVAVQDLLTKINVHGYWDVPRVYTNRRDTLNIIAHKGGQKLWMDEMGWASAPGNETAQAMDIARRIISDLKYMMPSAWLYWQIVESINEWGVISVPYRFDAKLEEVTVNSGYYGLMQFSKYIRQGMQLIYVSDGESVAAFDPTAKTLVIVTVHEDATNVTKSFDLNRFGGDLSIQSVTRSSATEKHESVGDHVTLGGRKVTLRVPETSITTTVISGVTYVSGQDRNLIVNPTFELGEGGWTVTENGSVASEEFPWRGKQHAYLPISEDITFENVLSQGFGVTSDSNLPTGRMYLTLFASTTGADTSIEGWADGKLEAVRVLNHRIGYRSYGISFPARSGGNVTIRVRSSSSHGPVWVDDAVMYYVPQADQSGGSVIKVTAFLVIINLLFTLF